MKVLLRPCQTGLSKPIHLCDRRAAERNSEKSKLESVKSYISSLSREAQKDLENLGLFSYLARFFRLKIRDSVVVQDPPGSRCMPWDCALQVNSQFLFDFFLHVPVFIIQQLVEIFWPSSPD